jgi:hypothetical protein
MAVDQRSENRHNRAMYCTNKDCPDFAVTGKHGEYRDDISHCPYCGERLYENLPASQAEEHLTPTEKARSQTWGNYEAPAPDDAHSDLEPVFETSDPTEIPVVRSFLDAQGIPHVVVGEERFDAFRGSLSPFRFNPKAGVVAFLVPTSFAELARELLEQIEEETGDQVPE